MQVVSSIKAVPSGFITYVMPGFVQRTNTLRGSSFEASEDTLQFGTIEDIRKGILEYQYEDKEGKLTFSIKDNYTLTLPTKKVKSLK